MGSYAHAGRWPPSSCGLIAGPLIERGLLRPMYGKDEVVLVLVTYAVFLILEDLTKLLWGVDPLSISEPYGLLGSFEIGGLTYPTYSLLLVALRSWSAWCWRWRSTARGTARSCRR